MQKRRINFLPLFLLSSFMMCFSFAADAQTTTFIYQGRFTDSTVPQPTNGNYTMTFRLFDAVTGGNQIPNNSTAISSTVSVVNGVFSTELDFGATAFNTTGLRYLEIQVGATVLTPRQQITATPFSMRAANAGSANTLSSTCSACVTNAQINSVDATKITGAISVTSGGTGATTASGARTNLGLGTLATVSPTGTANSTTFLRGDNTYAVIPTSGNTPVFSTRASAVTINSSTFVNIVSISLEANKTYYFDGAIYGNRAGATSGTANFRLTYTGTATTDLGVDVNGTLIPGTAFSSTSFDYESTGSSNTFTSTLSRRFNPVGYIRTTTAGTLTMQVARGATNTTVDLNIREGSYLRATPLN